MAVIPSKGELKCASLKITKITNVCKYDLQLDYLGREMDDDDDDEEEEEEEEDVL